MKTGLTFLLSLFFLSDVVMADDEVSLINPCINAFSNDSVVPNSFKVKNLNFNEGDLDTTGSSADALVRLILDAVGITRPVPVFFTIDVPNACATLDSSHRRIIYVSDEWLNEASGENRWVKIAILAHEVGHHINNHTHEDNLGSWLREYEADKFAGRVLKIIGRSREEALLAVERQPLQGSLNYPPRSVRQQAIRDGFGSAVQDLPEALTRRPEGGISIGLEANEAVVNDVISDQIDLLFSPKETERMFALSNLRASSQNNPEALSTMISVALEQPNNETGVQSVLSLMSAADEQTLRTISGDLGRLLASPDIGRTLRDSALVDQIQTKLGQ
ncbi:M48 family metalloprotease [Sinorhizobium medicae]|nr:M48 family metalloprotease [Sinorhizobium medicae]